MEDRFAGIREFVAVVDGGSLTAAADTLGVTGSAVGKSISRLEARVGVQLLHRTTRRLDLTTEGEAYLASCRRVLDELEETEALLTTGRRQPIGRLRVDLPTTSGGGTSYLHCCVSRSVTRVWTSRSRCVTALSTWWAKASTSPCASACWRTIPI